MSRLVRLLTRVSEEDGRHAPGEEITVGDDRAASLVRSQAAVILAEIIDKPTEPEQKPDPEPEPAKAKPAAKPTAPPQAKPKPKPKPTGGKTGGK